MKEMYIHIRYEKEGRSRRQVKARELWLLITQIQFETGVPYIIYKDHCNRKSNHRNLGTIKCSSFSTEIVQYSSSDEVAMCNTASIAVNMFVNSTKKTFDFYKLKEIVKIVTYNLDKMIDVNFYPLPEAKLSCDKHRSIGKIFVYNSRTIYVLLFLKLICKILGISVQGLADTFILMKYPFESEKANELNIQIFETLYYGALEASCEIAIEKGSYESYEGSPISKGVSIKKNYSYY